MSSPVSRTSLSSSSSSSFDDLLVFQHYAIDTAQIESLAIRVFENIFKFLGPEGQLSALNSLLKTNPSYLGSPKTTYSRQTHLQKIIAITKNTFLPKACTPLYCAKNTFLMSFLEESFERKSFSLTLPLFRSQPTGILKEVLTLFNLDFKDNLLQAPYSLTLSLDQSSEALNPRFVITQKVDTVIISTDKFSLSELN